VPQAARDPCDRSGKLDLRSFGFRPGNVNRRILPASAAWEPGDPRAADAGAAACAFRACAERLAAFAKSVEAGKAAESKTKSLLPVRVNAATFAASIADWPMNGRNVAIYIAKRTQR
jgi:hypothetical protein